MAICANEECRREIPAPRGEPFKSGPYQGGYFCEDCWVLHYDEHPQELADQATRAYFAVKARGIRERRHASAILFQEGQSQVFLTQRGTVRIEIANPSGACLTEYDPDRFRVLLRAIQAVLEKIPQLGQEP